jgi:hypothetical protein
MALVNAGLNEQDTVYEWLDRAYDVAMSISCVAGHRDLFRFYVSSERNQTVLNLEALSMPDLMPTPMPSGAFLFTSMPGSRNACQLIHPGAKARFVFKTAAFDRSATPPMQ